MNINKKLYRFFSVLLVISLFVSNLLVNMLQVTAINEDFAGGSGTETDPYLIETKEHLNNVRTNINAHYKMISNIIFEDSDFEEGGAFFNNGLGWAPIAPTMYSFKGSFDGNEYVIQGLKINTCEPMSQETGYGLFGGISGATIKNLKMTRTSILVNNNHYTYIGCISGYAYNSNITNCYVDGVITAKNSNGSCALYAGGIIGNAHKSLISNVESNVNINTEGNDRIGGICGYIGSGSIFNTTNRGALQGTSASGGITGEASSSIIENCTNYGDLNNIHPLDSIHGTSDCGGIVAWALGKNQIILCSNYGKISSSSTSETSSAAGIVASFSADRRDNAIISKCYNGGEISSKGVTGANAGGISATFYFATISDCFNLGKISSSFNAGGIISFAQGATITSCYNVGCITAKHTGGIIGENVSSSSISCYYLDESITGTTSIDGIIQNSEQLKNVNTYGSWNFDEIWTMEGREDYFYPELINNPILFFDELNSHKHSYSVSLTTPTCSKKGYTTYICNCGDIYFDDFVDVIGHSHIAKITTPATHTSTGVMTYTCSCGDTYTETIDKIEKHNHTAVVTTPTCTEQGYTTYTCECGDSYIDAYVDAVGHSYIAEVTTPATHLTTGVTTYTCICGNTYTEIIDKITTHNYLATVIEPTCVERGYTFYICECGDSYIDDYISVTEHNYEIEVTEPTCTEQGYTTYTCYDCGYSYKDNYVPVLGKVNGVSISDTTLIYKTADTIKPEINIDAGVNHITEYTSSNPSIVFVDKNGNITSIGGTGEVIITITVTDEYGNVVEDSCKVTVSYKWWQWLIIIFLFGWIWY